jgi:hypothetical protein
MPGCATLCKEANTCRLWQAGTRGLAFPMEMSHHMDTPATRWFTTWREADLLETRVSPQRGCATAIAEKLISAAQGQHRGGKAVQPSQGLLEPGAAIRSGGEAAIRSNGVGSNWSGGVGGGWRPGHGVGNHVFLARDMPDVAGVVCCVG